MLPELNDDLTKKKIGREPQAWYHQRKKDFCSPVMQFSTPSLVVRLISHPIVPTPLQSLIINPFPPIAYCRPDAHRSSRGGLTYSAILLPKLRRFWLRVRPASRPPLAAAASSASRSISLRSTKSA